MTANIDFREKIQIALSLGMLKKIDDKWFEELRSVLLDADNSLRCKRNRYAHDLYVFDTDAAQMKKIQFRTNIKHPQSHRPLELTTREETHITPDEIWQAAEDITIAAGKIALFAAQHSMMMQRRQKESPQKSS
jgi:hypothetical protein